MNWLGSVIIWNITKRAWHYRMSFDGMEVRCDAHYKWIIYSFRIYAWFLKISWVYFDWLQFQFSGCHLHRISFIHDLLWLFMIICDFARCCVEWARFYLEAKRHHRIMKSQRLVWFFFSDESLWRKWMQTYRFNKIDSKFKGRSDALFRLCWLIR
jgi:hypothetical protein